ncbi:hypothetical protein [Mycolicibacterium sp. P1-5]|uniref:hypothetical protein n=1 Tax=Mycolicibacterium sp. P1-5 TaxID=2024617 RepID=UPI0011ECAF06|nr:hypothetical protein [Mycolicibacterium sp. P1-5]KAA0103062.1 hypothetical protein CIW47_23610 [Mycolicibacterium sp. P1-5]
MESSLHYGRTLTAALLVSASALFAAPQAFADPQTEQPAPAPGPVNVAAPAALPPDAPAPDAVPPDQGAYSAVVTACKQFGVALDYAANNYEDFAYNTAGGGNNVNYDDPNVADSNVRGRTALREAASTGMDAANTPGLPGDISAPMRSWSMRAAKLLVIMGIRAGGDSLNSTAGDMNTDAKNAQMACAVNGGRA